MVLERGFQIERANNAGRLDGLLLFLRRGSAAHAKLGRQLGFPTANLVVDPACRLRHAIYAVEVAIEGQRLKGQRLKGVASFGRRPTIDNGPPLLEVYIFDFDADIYGKEIEVFFIDFLRPELKFDSLEALTAQIGRDEIAARGKLGV